MTATAQQVVDLLLERGLTLATCESLTAGMIGATITTVPGSSEVFRGGLITYAADLKTRLAGVDADEIAAHGVVNSHTATQMAVGAAEVCQTDLAVAVTGVAGPGPSDGVPAGSVWIAVAAPTSWPVSRVSRRFAFTGDRQEVREATVEAALTMILEVLNDKKVRR